MERDGVHESPWGPESMERAAKQQELSDGYRALFGDLPTSMYTQYCTQYIVK